jgi:hypothetical protein
MSMIRCDVCQRYVDQDFHETHGPTGETCEDCALEAEEELLQQAEMACADDEG